jgi:broad specificity phosphatase PhoE
VVSFPKGESGKDFVERFSNGVKQMIEGNEPGNLAAVCHGGHILFGLKEICANASGKQLWGNIMSNCSIRNLDEW